MGKFEFYQDCKVTSWERDPQAPVMVAVQPSWPFEHSITGVINAQNGTVYLASKQEGYLPPEAKEAFEENGIPF